MITGLGSLPGTDFVAALRDVFEWAPEEPWFPELTQRGWHYSMISRAIAVNSFFPAEVVGRSWRVASHSTRAQRRAESGLRSDLDDFEAGSDGYAGPVRIAFAGPVTVASMLQLPGGEAVVSDAGALRDLTASWGAALATLRAELNRRMPQITWLVQCDEPAWAAVAAGQVPTYSGLRRYPALSAETWHMIAEMLRDTVQSWHSCGAVADFPEGLQIVPDPDLLSAAMLEQWYGRIAADAQPVLPVLAAANQNQVPHPEILARRAQLWCDRAGVAPDTTLLAPTCGLGTWRRDSARMAFRTLRDAAELIR